MVPARCWKKVFPPLIYSLNLFTGHNITVRLNNQQKPGQKTFIAAIGETRIQVIVFDILRLDVREKHDRSLVPVHCLSLDFEYTSDFKCCYFKKLYCSLGTCAPSDIKISLLNELFQALTYFFPILEANSSFNSFSFSGISPARLLTCPRSA